jgi:hypothetical protein
MKSAPLNKSYIVLAGSVVVMVALVLYMWIDARKLERSLSRKPEPLPTVNRSAATQPESANPMKQVRRDITSRPQLKPGEIVRGDTVSENPVPLKNPLERNKTVMENRKPLRKEVAPPAPGQKADWLFESGQVEEEEEVAGGETPVPE